MQDIHRWQSFHLVGRNIRCLYDTLKALTKWDCTSWKMYKVHVRYFIHGLKDHRSFTNRYIIRCLMNGNTSFIRDMYRDICRYTDYAIFIPRIVEGTCDCGDHGEYMHMVKIRTSVEGTPIYRLQRTREKEGHGHIDAGIYEPYNYGISSGNIVCITRDRICIYKLIGAYPSHGKIYDHGEFVLIAVYKRYIGYWIGYENNLTNSILILASASPTESKYIHVEFRVNQFTIRHTDARYPMLSIISDYAGKWRKFPGNHYSDPPYMAYNSKHTFQMILNSGLMPVKKMEVIQLSFSKSCLKNICPSVYTDDDVDALARDPKYADRIIRYPMRSLSKQT